MKGASQPMAVGANRNNMIDFTLQTQKKEMIDALCALLKIESVKSEPQTNMPYGKGVFDALINVLNLGEKMYFDSVNLYSHMGYVEYGDGDEMLAILTHLDVMPAGEGWTVPAFEGTIKDGKIFGRGAIDNKGPAIASLFALNAIKENCITLNKRVRLIFGCDEESGWSDISFYRENGGETPVMALSPDAEFPIINSEKGLLQVDFRKEAYSEGDGRGVVLLSLNGGDRVNAVPSQCVCEMTAQAPLIKQMVDLFNEDAPVKVEFSSEGDNITLRTKGVSAHGSKPETGVNAVSYMVIFLNQLPLIKNHISETVYALAKKIALQTDGSYLGIAQEDESGSLTLNLGNIKTDDKGIVFGLDIRYPVQMEKKQIVDALQTNFAAFEMKENFALPAHFVKEDSTLVQGLKKAYEEITGQAAHCISIGGATYARAFPNSVAFGPLFPGQKGTEHQPDEYIEIESFLKLADIIANAIVILCK